ncbi:hypothetical protein [Paenibacillus sp. DYY-L-2]|uniref:hypothetical protein n=1 Tax=Paenibacillus sp. DYY-L-2 TaxID=3447013 RepID=UPI003F4F4E6A
MKAVMGLFERYECWECEEKFFVAQSNLGKMCPICGHDDPEFLGLYEGELTEVSES